jgi:hypothetical protein
MYLKITLLGFELRSRARQRVVEFASRDLEPLSGGNRTGSGQRSGTSDRRRVRRVEEVDRPAVEEQQQS